MEKYNFALEDVSVYSNVLSLLARHRKVVGLHLDFGCGHAAIAAKIMEDGCHYIGFDSNHDTVATLHQRGIEAHLLDLCDTEAVRREVAAVVAGRTISSVSLLDVIEHLPQPQPLLHTLHSLLPEDAVLVLSVPNFSHFDVAVKLLHGRWHYAKTGLLDDTHHIVFTEGHLTQLMLVTGWRALSACDYKLEISEQYNLAPDYLLNRELGLGGLLRDLSGRLRNSADTYQFVRAFRKQAFPQALPVPIPVIQPGLCLLLLLPHAEDLAVARAFLQQHAAPLPCAIVVGESGFASEPRQQIFAREDRTNLAAYLAGFSYFVPVDMSMSIAAATCLALWQQHAVRIHSRPVFRSSHSDDLRLRDMADRGMYPLDLQEGLLFPCELAADPHFDLSALLAGQREMLVFTALLCGVADLPAFVNPMPPRAEEETLCLWQTLSLSRFPLLFRLILQGACSRSVLREALPSAELLQALQSLDAAVNLLNQTLEAKESSQEQCRIAVEEGHWLRQRYAIAINDKVMIEQQLQRCEQQLQALEQEAASQRERYANAIDDKLAVEQQLQQCEQQFQALVPEAAWLRDELYRVHHTLSWRITRPIRFVRRLMVEPRDVARRIYQRFRGLVQVRMLARHALQNVRNGLWYLVDSADNSRQLRAMAMRRDVSWDSLQPQPVQDWPAVDITVVAYNNARWLDNFLKSLAALDYPHSRLFLHLVDNGSDAQNLALLQAGVHAYQGQFGGFTLRQQPNLGFGAGHDLAISQGSADYVLVSNMDLEFEPDALKQVVRQAMHDSAGRYASWELRQLPYEHPKHYDPVTLEVSWSSHACILMRRDAYQQVGGYDERIFMYCEDVELSYRYRSYGYLLQYCPSAIVHHFSYEKAGEVKPVQFSGSTLGNAYLRLRYGALKDRLAIMPLYAALLLAPAPYHGARRTVLGNMRKIVRNYRHFRRGAGPVRGVYPFRAFDYEMVREGAFHTGTRCSSGPRVSVIMRTYRDRQYLLQQAILSVFNQTYQNIELLVVEDGGDTHRALVTQLAATTGHTIVYLACDKVGRSVTGNRAMAAASGDYMMFLDDDDLIYPDHVETLMAELCRDPALDGAYALATQVFTNVAPDKRSYVEVEFDCPATFHQPFDYEVLRDHNFLPIQSVLFKRSIFLECGGFEEDMDYLEDWNLWLRFCHGRQFKYIAKTTSLFRVPADLAVRHERHMQLHGAYEQAKARALARIEKLNSSKGVE